MQQQKSGWFDFVIEKSGTVLSAILSHTIILVSLCICRFISHHITLLCFVIQVALRLWWHAVWLPQKIIWHFSGPINGLYLFQYCAGTTRMPLNFYIIRAAFRYLFVKFTNGNLQRWLLSLVLMTVFIISVSLAPGTLHSRYTEGGAIQKSTSRILNRAPDMTEERRITHWLRRGLPHWIESFAKKMMVALKF